MGRTLQGGAKGPGLFFIVPCIGNYLIISVIHLKTKIYVGYAYKDLNSFR
jgi:hypothetical protein